MTDRELDALVAEKVIRDHVDHEWGEEDVAACRACERWNADPDCPQFCIPKYSTDMKAAWTVAQKARTFFVEKPKDLVGYRCCYDGVVAHSQSAQRAICLAALKAVGVEVKP